MSKSATREHHRHRTLIAIGVIAAAFLISAHAEHRKALAEEQVPCVEMIEGWYSVNASRLERHLHDEFVKQGVYRNAKTGDIVKTTHSRDEFIALVGSDRSALPEEEWDISVETLHAADLIATVRVTSAHLVDVCQLGKVDDKWQVINVLWTTR